jgi:major membrane immunogen (membrane-anchored lipoprotein)
MRKEELAVDKCRFVLTEFDDEHNYNFCDGVFDDPDMVLGKILGNIIDSMYDYKAEEVKIRFEHDDANDDYYDIVCKIPRKDFNPAEEQEQVYRVFYLREKEQAKGDEDE